jgi:hypothetical protein
MKKMIVLIVLFSFSAMAGPFSITNRAGLGGAGTLVMDMLEDEVNSSLPDANGASYAPGMANASAAAGHGIGTDYSNDLDFMMVSANVGIGLDTGNSELGDFISGDSESNSVRGFGLTSALTIGLDLGILPVDKLGPIDLEKMDVFFSFMKLDNGEDGDDVKAEMTHFGFHARYHLMDGISVLPGGLLKWGGLFVSAGIEKNTMDIKMTEALSEDVTDSTSGGTATFNGTATFGAEADTTSIPIEVSTYVQTLYALTFFGGLGVDFNFGDAKAVGNVNGTVNVGGGGGTSGTGDAALDLSGSGDVESTTMRGFFGVQIGVPLVKFYVQLNKQFTGDNVAGIASGLKVVW